jgi:hypothetical protein
VSTARKHCVSDKLPPIPFQPLLNSPLLQLSIRCTHAHDHLWNACGTGAASSGSPGKQPAELDATPPVTGGNSAGQAEKAAAPPMPPALSTAPAAVTAAATKSERQAGQAAPQPAAMATAGGGNRNTAPMAAAPAGAAAQGTAGLIPARQQQLLAATESFCTEVQTSCAWDLLCHSYTGHTCTPAHLSSALSSGAISPHAGNLRQAQAADPQGVRPCGCGCRATACHCPAGS